MASDPNPPDARRTRNGLICLVMGVVLVLWAWGSWVYRTSEPADIPTGREQNGLQAAADQAAVDGWSPVALVGGLFVFLLVLFTGYVLWQRWRGGGAATGGGPPASTVLREGVNRKTVASGQESNGPAG